MLNFLFKLSDNKIIYRLLLVLLVIELVWFQFYGMKLNLDLSKNPLDLRLGYSSQDVINYLTYRGEAGRDDYKFALSVIDVIFPILYGLILIIDVSKIAKKFFNSNPVVHLLFVSTPVGVVVFDLLENKNTLSMIAAFPNITEDMAAKGSIYTLAKWSLGGLTALIIGYGIIKTRAMKRARKKY